MCFSISLKFNKRRKSTNWKKHFDCVPSQDGPICATKVNQRDNVREEKTVI